jgi:hypothetical protein
MTEQCRILGERHTQFPFNCSLGDFITPKKLVDGLQIGERVLHIRCARGGAGLLSPRQSPQRPPRCCALRPGPHPNPCPRPPATRREHTFLDNPRTPAEVRAPAPAVVSVGPGGKEGLSLTSEPPRVLVAGPVTDTELRSKVVRLSKSNRRLHAARPWEVFRGFADARLTAQFQEALRPLPTYWCCRSPQDQEKKNLTDRVQYTFDPSVVARIQKLAVS